MMRDLPAGWLLSVSTGALLAANLALGASAMAQTAATVTELDEISVTADRVPQAVYDSPSTVSVTTAKEIERKIINSPRDLVLDEPGVSVSNSPTRTGSGNFNIRGIGGNRVLLLLDGYRVPDVAETNVGLYTRDYIDFDSLKQVEIIRGPSSAVYGSDAIGGVVSFVTKDPADYLDLVGKDWYMSSKIGVDSKDRSIIQTHTGAWRMGPWEAMILYTRRSGHEIKPNTFRTPNPQDYLTQNAMLKSVYNAGDWGRFRFTAEILHRRLDTDLNTELGTSMGTTTLLSKARDTTQRPRFSLDWTKPLDWAIADTVTMRGFYTQVERDEDTQQLRRVGGAPNSPPNRYRLTNLDYDQEVYGGDIQFNALRRWGAFEHNIVYGATIDQSNTSRPRDRFETNLVTGTTTKTFAGELFPNKNFPDTETVQGAVYIQDIMRYDRLRLIPALRLDYFQLAPFKDQLFLNGGFRGLGIEKQTETALSPKLGATYDLTDNYRVFGQYAKGFRAPPYDSANIGFSNPLQGYEVLPNGNLKPETSDGFEAGLRGRFENGSSFQVSGFYNLYDDFIEQTFIGLSPQGLQQFRAENLNKVRIYGAEAKGEWRFHPTWSLFGAVAYANGENEETGLPIDSVDPFTYVAGLRYRDAAGFGGELRVRGAAGKKRVSQATYVKTDAYAAVDALFTYDYGVNWSFNLGVFNIFDQRYFNPQDVVAVSVTNPNLELFRAPGRSVGVSSIIRF